MAARYPAPRTPQPPYELRPGTGRRGPDDLWERFDRAVAALNRAITGSDAAAVADAFGELSQTAVTLAEAVEREDAAREGEDRAREPHGTEAQEHERRVRSRGAA